MPEVCYRLVVFAGGWLLLAGAAMAADWSGQLRNGGRVTVDVHTQRVFLQGADGARTLLGDGAYPLADGSVLTVRSGIAVPTPAMLDVPEEPAEEEDEGMCARLVAHSCGTGRECAATPACDAARQLQTLSAQGGRAERRDGQSRCREALANPYFTGCAPVR